MSRPDFEKLEVFQLAERLADAVWKIVWQWQGFAQRTVGAQLVRACDSVGANIAEGAGKGSFNDNRRFVRIARGSLNETRYWLRRAFTRSPLTQAQVDDLRPMLDELSPRLNAYLKSIGTQRGNFNNASNHVPNPTVCSTDNGQLTTDH